MVTCTTSPVYVGKCFDNGPLALSVHAQDETPGTSENCLCDAG